MKHSFTLLELLIVVVILGVLLSLLMPAISQARSKSLQAVCINNIAQSTKAVFAYAGDNKMYGPTEDGHVSGDRWFNNLQKGYLPQGKIADGSSIALNCPIAKDVSVPWESPLSMNVYVSGGEFKEQATLMKATGSETCLFMDSYSNWRKAYEVRMALDKLMEAPVDIRVAKHFEKANVGFVDGSVKSLSVMKMLQYSSPTHTFWDVSQ